MKTTTTTATDTTIYETGRVLRSSTRLLPPYVISEQDMTHKHKHAPSLARMQHDTPHVSGLGVVHFCSEDSVLDFDYGFEQQSVVVNEKT